MHIKRYLEKYGIFNPKSIPIENFKTILKEKLP